MTNRLREALASCTSEEDVRVNMELVLRDALPDLPTPRYEKSVKTSTFKGRADAVHQGLVIEYEKPHSMRAATKRDQAVQQVCDYLTGFALGEQGRHQEADPRGLLPPDTTYSQDEEERLAANVGLATDGDRFVFVQRLGKKWQTDPRKLDEDTVEKLLLWLRAMNRKDLSPENLISDFGPEAKLATAVVGILAKLVDSHKYPKAKKVFQKPSW